MLDVRNMMGQRREPQRGMRFCLLAYPCQVWAHRGFTPCVVSVFPLSRVLERGTFHSTGISRFIARPGPVPLQSHHGNGFFYVARPYSGSNRAMTLFTSLGPSADCMGVHISPQISSANV